MLETLILFVFLSWAVMTIWSIWWNHIKPPLMPFSIFKWACSLGHSIDISELPEGMDGLTKMAYADKNYINWFAEVMGTGAVTRLEFHAFNRQRLIEIDAEIKRRGLK